MDRILVGIALILLLSACKVPRPTATSGDPFPDYITERDALLLQDSLLYFDHEEVLSPVEMRLNAHLSSLQREMISSYREEHFFPPARNFYQSKQHIEESKLFGILKMMPKGGILHLHLSAMGDADWMIERAIATPEMHVFWGRDSDEDITGQMRAYSAGAAPPGYEPAHVLAARLPDFRQSLRKHLTFDEQLDRDSVDIWSRFEDVFQRITGFVTYEPIWTDYLVHGLEILAADGIQHAELRVPFFNTLYRLDRPPQLTAMTPFVETLVAAQRRIRQVDPAFTLNIIHANLRFFDEETIWNDMMFTHVNRARYPQWVKGYDLVAEEDAGHPTLFHAKNFLRLDSLEKATGVSLPLYLHDGESDWASVDNLYDAILLGTRRIGHGFNLFRFPNLLRLVRERDICMEINPLSNQILGYLRDLRIHPASTYLRRGVQCTISSDDPLIFDYHGLTYDFWSVYLAWELDLAGIKRLCRNSITYSAMSAKEKTTAMAVWEQRWEKFIVEALEEFNR